MNIGRIYNKITDVSVQEMMGNLSKKKLLVISPQYIMNHDFRMYTGKSRSFREQ
jgi:hypothetical protein